MRKLIVACMAGTALMLSACYSDEPVSEGENAAAEAGDWDGFVDAFLTTYYELNPTFAVGQGKHEFDGQLPDLSDIAIAERIAFLKDTRAAAAAFDTDALDEADAFERNYLIAQMDSDLFWLETYDAPHRSIDLYRGVLSPATYVTVPYADAETRYRAYTTYLENVPEFVEQMRANLQTPLPRTFVELGIGAFQGYADYYQGDARTEFSEITDIDLIANHDVAMEAAVAAMEEAAEWLREELPNATDDFAMGEEMFAQMLFATERVDTPIAELEAIGRADLERNQAALGEACSEFAPGQTIMTCIEMARANKAAGGPVQGARDQLGDLRTFVAENNIVTIPSDEEALVAELPPYRRSNLAYINIPGPYETGLPSTYYITPPDPSWDAATREAYIPGRTDLLFVSVHEVWPGHFLNFLHAQRSDSIFGRVFVGYAFAEGWAHYTEEMMWDAGLGEGDAETHIGQLTNALLRDVRYLSAIGLHTGGMTVAQSQQMFLEDGYQSEGSAIQQAARGTYDPAYLNYTMGKLLIMQLRDDWIATRGGREAWLEFHDTFLSYGGPPIPLVRQAMMEEDTVSAVFP